MKIIVYAVLASDESGTRVILYGSELGAYHWLALNVNGLDCSQRDRLLQLAEAEDFDAFDVALAEYASAWNIYTVDIHTVEVRLALSRAKTP
jgi:hypothetical protein